MNVCKKERNIILFFFLLSYALLTYPVLCYPCLYYPYLTLPYLTLPILWSTNVSKKVPQRLENSTLLV